MGVLVFMVRAGVGLGLVGASLAAIGALLGFMHPLLDALNHLQPFLLAGTLAGSGLVLVLFRRGRAKRLLLGAGLAGLTASGIIVLPEQFSAPPLSTPVEGRQVFTIMTHNLFGMNYDMARMADVIARKDPDIIALQEYANMQRAGLHPRIVGRYPYFVRCAGRKHSYIALYAKMPFRLEDSSQCASNASLDNNPAARLVARFTDRDGTPFHVVATHLNWPVQIRPLRNNQLGWSEKIAAMTARKQGEWADLATAMQSLDGPAVLVGDFNSTSWSYSLRNFARRVGLTRYSRGLLTYPKLFYIMGWRETPAILPIDHLMASKDIRMHAVWRGNTTGSDHLPIYGRFSVAPVDQP